MKIKPILFNTNDVIAFLGGRKRCSRLKIPIDIVNNCDVETDGKLLAYENCDGDFIEPVKLCRYQPGDILYVRETWQYLYELDGNEQIIEDTGKYYYAATDTITFNTYVDENGLKHENVPWKPSIHMPKEAARIWLKVTDVRVERLQEITPDAIKNEGIILNPQKCVGKFDHTSELYYLFQNLWNSTIKKSDLDRYGWDANPYVFVIEFERCEKPEYA